jgi:hypothetical protein
VRIAILYQGIITDDNGTSERVYQIAKYLTDYKVNVTVAARLSSNMSKLDISHLTIIPIPHKIAELVGVLNWLSMLLSRGLTRRYDIIQIECFSLLRSLLLILLSQVISRRVIIVFHDKLFKSDPRKSVVGRLQLFLQRILLTICDISITPGATVKHWFEKLNGQIVSAKMVVIPNGTPENDVQFNADSNHIRERLKIPRNSFIALFFGSMAFDPNYDTAVLLKNMSEIVAHDFQDAIGKNLIFVVAGKGSEKLQKGKHFLPVGYISQLSDLLSIPDVVVLPHLPSYSGPHVKTSYAFQSGKPLAATEDAVKDMPNVISGEHFLMFDASEPSTLSSILVRLYCDETLRNKIIKNAYFYSKKNSWKKIAYLHLSVYMRIIR